MSTRDRRNAGCPTSGQLALAKQLGIVLTGRTFEEATIMLKAGRAKLEQQRADAHYEKRAEFIQRHQIHVGSRFRLRARGDNAEIILIVTGIDCDCYLSVKGSAGRWSPVNDDLTYLPPEQAP